GIIVLVFLSILLNIAKNLKEAFFPSPPPAPTVSYGKLNGISFPQSDIAKNFTYTLDTVSGGLPQLPTQARIYKGTLVEPNLLALKRAQDKVASLGFTQQGTPITQTDYLFQSFDPNSKLNSKLQLNILSYNFTLTTDYATNPDIVAGFNLPDEKTATDRAKNFLSSLVTIPKDIDLSKTTTTLLSVAGSHLLRASSFSNAQIIRVDFFVKDLNSLPVVYLNPPSSPITVFVGGGKSFTPSIVKANYFHLDLTGDFSTYPLITATDAFSQLKQNKGYIASYDGTDKTVVIKSVYLAYYYGPEEGQYILPVVVFEGNDNFKAYVSAVGSDWIQSK